MSGAFWTSWALWEKLCFCLGAAIAIVIILGCLKLLYNRWRLRKYTAIAATKTALKRDMQHPQSVRRGRAREVPFGVRALESGIEVEGVWVSGTNTPANSTPGTPELLAKAKSAHREPPSARASSASTMSQLEMPQPNRGYPMVLISSESNNQQSSPFADPRLSAEGMHQPSPTSERLPHTRPTYKPRRSSQLRYSDSMNTGDPEVFKASEGRSLGAERKGKGREGSEFEYEERDRSVSGSGSSNSDSNEAPNQPSGTQRPPNGLLRPAEPNHSRGSHLAACKPSNIDSVRINAHDARVDEHNHLVPNRYNVRTVASEAGQDTSAKDTGTPAHESTDPFATPTRTIPDEHVPVFHLDDDSTYYPMMSHDGTVEVSSNAETSMPFYSSRQLRRSQVARNVNPGFQILRPGTLDATVQSSNNAEGEENRASNKRQPRKLQRRSRANSYSVEEP